MAGELAYDPGTGQLVYSPATGQLAKRCICACTRATPGAIITIAGACADSPGFCADYAGTYSFFRFDNRQAAIGGCQWQLNIDGGGAEKLYLFYCIDQGHWAAILVGTGGAYGFDLDNPNGAVMASCGFVLRAAFPAKIPDLTCIDSVLTGSFSLLGVNQTFFSTDCTGCTASVTLT